MSDFLNTTALSRGCSADLLGTAVPTIAPEPDLETLPRRVDRPQVAALVSLEFPTIPRALKTDRSHGSSWAEKRPAKRPTSSRSRNKSWPQEDASAASRPIRFHSLAAGQGFEPRSLVAVRDRGAPPVDRRGLQPGLRQGGEVSADDPDMGGGQRRGAAAEAPSGEVAPVGGIRLACGGALLRLGMRSGICLSLFQASRQAPRMSS